MKKFISVLLVVLFPICFSSCDDDWFDAKPSQNLAVLETLKDIQLLLDNTENFNWYNYPAMGEEATPDSYLNDDDYAGLTQADRNTYIWASGENFYEGTPVDDWDLAYTAISYANIALDQLDKIDVNSTNREEWEKLRGTALFHRAITFFNVAQVFAKPYVESTASSDLGIIMRLTANVNDPSERVTVKQTYDKILSDLEEAAELLPEKQELINRPSKHAVYGLLARVYLSMGKYPEALQWADEALAISNTLMDFNDPQYQFGPYPTYNPETIFFSMMVYSPISPMLGGIGSVDPNLLALYTLNDRRLTAFFADFGKIMFLGNYAGDFGYVFHFSGLATDEMFLIRAECLARAGQTALAMEAVNALYEKRWNTDTGAFVPYTAATADEALSIVLLERRKELCFRGLTWSDLRRLNQDPDLAVTLERVVNGVTYTLPPNNERYVYPIPDNEIRLSGVPQNHR
jgi:tetratricopeptide (TPR) repeat protein